MAGGSCQPESPKRSPRRLSADRKPSVRCSCQPSARAAATASPPVRTTHSATNTRESEGPCSSAGVQGAGPQADAESLDGHGTLPMPAQEAIKASQISPLLIDTTNRELSHREHRPLGCSFRLKSTTLNEKCDQPETAEEGIFRCISERMYQVASTPGQRARGCPRQHPQWPPRHATWPSASGSSPGCP